MKTLRWLIVFVAAAVVVYLLLSRPGARPDRQTHIVMDSVVAAAPAPARATGVPQIVEKTKEGLSKSGEVMTNEWITTRVHARFVDEDLLKGSDISVDTDDHVVTLKGTVVSRAGRNRAARAALNTEGVHRVVNRLTIGPKR
jgi:osmotically-inducible protein OsmY